MLVTTAGRWVRAGHPLERALAGVLVTMKTPEAAPRGLHGSAQLRAAKLLPSPLIPTDQQGRTTPALVRAGRAIRCAVDRRRWRLAALAADPSVATEGNTPSLRAMLATGLGDPHAVDADQAGSVADTPGIR